MTDASLHPVALHITADPQGTTRVKIVAGGIDVTRSVAAFRVSAVRGKPIDVSLDLDTPEITTFGDAQPRFLISPDVRNALIALGWTPPAHDRA